METIQNSRRTVITVPMTEIQRQALDTLKAQGIQKGHWVAQAIREKMERDGLLDRQEEKAVLHE